jgi:hypothetical protein
MTRLIQKICVLKNFTADFVVFAVETESFSFFCQYESHCVVQQMSEPYSFTVKVQSDPSKLVQNPVPARPRESWMVLIFNNPNISSDDGLHTSQFRFRLTDTAEYAEHPASYSETLMPMHVKSNMYIPLVMPQDKPLELTIKITDHWSYLKTIEDPTRTEVTMTYEPAKRSYESCRIRIDPFKIDIYCRQETDMSPFIHSKSLAKGTIWYCPTRINLHGFEGFPADARANLDETAKDFYFALPYDLKRRNLKRKYNVLVQEDNAYEATIYRAERMAIRYRTRRLALRREKEGVGRLLGLELKPVHGILDKAKRDSDSESPDISNDDDDEDEDD